MIVRIIAAMTADRVIGVGDKLPWRIPEELSFFKETTIGNTLVMGRKTVEGIGRLLPNRETIIISRNPHFVFPGAVSAQSLEDALRIAEGFGNDVFIAGGSEIYKAALESTLVDEIILSIIPGEYIGDKFFPVIDSDWVLQDVQERDKFIVQSYVRVV